MTILEAARALGPLRRSGAEWHGPCPSCRAGDDRFFVNAGGGVAGTGRYACRRCGEAGNAVDLLTRHLGMSEARARVELGLDGPGDWAKRPAALGHEARRFRYAAPDGRRTLDVVRYEAPDDHPLAGTKDGKTYRPAAPDGPPGRRPKVDRHLYRATAVAEAVAAGEPVFVCEGEPAAEAVAALGLCGTTAEGGAGKWAGTDARPLAGADVVVLPDNDGAGEAHASTVAASLVPVARRVRVLRLPGLPSKGDAVEYVAGGGTREGLLALAETAGAAPHPPSAPPHEDGAPEASQAPVPLGVCVADVEAEAVRWMWGGRLSAGKVHLLDGDPGTGKSTVYAYLSACVTAGVPWPDGEAVAPSARGGAVIVTAEDDVATTIRPRLEAAGADVSAISVVTLVPTPSGAGRMPVLPDDVDALLAECGRVGARLLVLDPVTAYLGEVNSPRDSDVRGRLAPLAEGAERAGVAVVLVRHLNKGGGGPALYRGGGSIAFSGLARVVLLAARVPDDPDRRALAVVKNNLAPFAPTLGYHLESAGPFGVGRTAWHGPVPYTADDLVRPPSGPAETPARDEAAEFLLDALADGSRLAREVYAEAEAAGIAERTLKRAKAQLGVEAERRGGVGGGGAWYWLLPGGAAKGATSGDGTTGPAPEWGAGPKRATEAPLPDPVAPLARGPAPGDLVTTPHGPGTVQAPASAGRVSVEVDGLPVSFPLDLVAPTDAPF